MRQYGYRARSLLVIRQDMDLRRETGVGLIPRAGVIRSTHGERGDQTRGRADVIRCLGRRLFGSLQRED